MAEQPTRRTSHVRLVPDRWSTAPRARDVLLEVLTGVADPAADLAEGWALALPPPPGQRLAAQPEKLGGLRSVSSSIAMGLSQSGIVHPGDYDRHTMPVDDDECRNPSFQRAGSRIPVKSTSCAVRLTAGAFRRRFLSSSTERTR